MKNLLSELSEIIVEVVERRHKIEHLDTSLFSPATQLSACQLAGLIVVATDEQPRAT